MTFQNALNEENANKLLDFIESSVLIKGIDPTSKRLETVANRRIAQEQYNLQKHLIDDYWEGSTPLETFNEIKSKLKNRKVSKEEERTIQQFLTTYIRAINKEHFKNFKSVECMEK